MSRTSKTNSAARHRSKRSASKGGGNERTLLPNAGNVSVTINVVWPDGGRSAAQEASSVGPLIWKAMRYCLDKLWALFRL